jgi:hypothetical protein
MAAACWQRLPSLLAGEALGELLCDYVLFVVVPFGPACHHLLALCLLRVHHTATTPCAGGYHKPMLLSATDNNGLLAGH